MRIIFLLLSIFYAMCSLGMILIPSIDFLTRITLFTSFGIAALVTGESFYKYKWYNEK